MFRYFADDMETLDWTLGQAVTSKPEVHSIMVDPQTPDNFLVAVDHAIVLLNMDWDNSSELIGQANVSGYDSWLMLD